MQNIDELHIRKAELKDAVEIARVHIASWKKAYEGIIHQVYLDHGLDLDERTEAWAENLRSGRMENYIVFVACEDDHIVGFADAGIARDDDMQDFLEIYSIYLHPKYFDRGIGARLFHAIRLQAPELRYAKLYVWVIDQNIRAREFYERMGGVFKDGVKKESVIDGHSYVEVKYCWERLDAA